MYKNFSISGGKIDSRNGHLINEDLLLVGKNYVILVDGSTGLGNKYLDDDFTSAEWYTQNLLAYLKTKLDVSDELTKSDILKIVRDSILYITSLISKKQSELGIQLEKFEIPSCSLLIVFENVDRIILFSLGDCIAMIKNKDSDDVETIRGTRINELDNQVFAMMKNISVEKGISIKETMKDPKIIEMLRINRSKMNTVNGYYIASIDEHAVDYAIVREYDKESVEKIFICSDGFYLDALDLSCLDFVNHVTNDNLSSYIDAVKSKLLSDKDWSIYSDRFKDLDDITAIVAYTNSYKK